METHQSNNRLLLFVAMVIAVLCLVVGLQRMALAASSQQTITTLSPEADSAAFEAQDTALADSRISDYLEGHRAEVFVVKDINGDHYPTSAKECATATCKQVEIYLWDVNDTVSAIVNMDSGQLIEAIYHNNVQPMINDRVFDLAVDLIQKDPDVRTTLGFTPSRENMHPMTASFQDIAGCSAGNYCVGYVFAVDSGNVAVVVDATEERVANVWWNERSEDPDTLRHAQVPEPVSPRDCSGSLSISQDGWTMDYLTTPSDSLRISNVKFNGVDVATSVKLVEWHARYSNGWGYEDYTGCGASGSGHGFAIYPSGDAYTQTMGTGFELIQNFEMSNWGASCNYRYEQHFQFWPDGSWRVVTGAFGEGCGDDRDEEAAYRAVVRIDIAVDGDADDSFQTWDGSAWVDETVEGEWWQDTSAASNTDFWRVIDSSGKGYYIEPGQGQFRDAGTGDSAWMYAVLHDSGEGDSDLPTIGDYNPVDSSPDHGPHNFTNSESIDEENIVLWYVPQSQTITTWEVTNTPATAQYCWTDGVNQGEYWPCWSGPKFKPFTEVPTAVDMQSAETGNSTISSTTYIISLMTVIGMLFTAVTIVRRNNSR